MRPLPSRERGVLPGTSGAGGLRARSVPEGVGRVKCRRHDVGLVAPCTCDVAEPYPDVDDRVLMLLASGPMMVSDLQRRARYDLASVLAALARLTAMGRVRALFDTGPQTEHVYDQAPHTS